MFKDFDLDEKWYEDRYKVQHGAKVPLMLAG